MSFEGKSGVLVIANLNSKLFVGIGFEGWLLGFGHLS